ncbi:MAG: HAMP domain-containing sensor histidine kinase [Candidatus Zixiibacteriota bacterium]
MFTPSIEPCDFTVACDPDRIEQVLTNLTDNVNGIVAGAIDQVFIPFFTTKKGGTGIGLALSQQIMRLHRGQVSVRSAPNERTIFTLTF